MVQLATTHRRKQRYSETLNRRVLGEKGIGRLAAGRLGRIMNVDTRRAESEEISLELDWSEFDDENKFLDQIDIRWGAGEADVFAVDGTADAVFAAAGVEEWNNGRGTRIALSELSTTWTREMVIDLRNALSRLLPPAAGRSNVVPDFRVYLDFPEHSVALADLAGLVEEPAALGGPPTGSPVGSTAPGSGLSRYGLGTSRSNRSASMCRVEASLTADHSKLTSESGTAMHSATPRERPDCSSTRRAASPCTATDSGCSPTANAATTGCD